MCGECIDTYVAAEFELVPPLLLYSEVMGCVKLSHAHLHEDQAENEERKRCGGDL